MDIFFHLALLPASLFALWKSSAKREPGSTRAVVLPLVGLGLWILLLVGLCASSLFHAMRLLSWVLFGYGPILLLAASLRSATGRGLGRLLGLGALLLLGLGFWAFCVEPRRIELTFFEVESAKVENRLRIVLVADLQTDQFGEHERKALDLVAAQQADLILFAGDYVQEGDLQRRRFLRREIRDYMAAIDLRAPLGVYAVRGDVDDLEWASMFEGLPVETFQRTTVRHLPGITLTALDRHQSRNHRAEYLPSDRFHVILGHAPDFALDDPPADLLLAGHTHGGQVRLPGIGALITLSEIPRAWAAGKTRLPKGQTLVVSRGIGMERGKAPRLRFFCRPEVVVIDVVPAAAGGAR